MQPRHSNGTRVVFRFGGLLRERRGKSRRRARQLFSFDLTESKRCRSRDGLVHFLMQDAFSTYGMRMMSGLSASGLHIPKIKLDQLASAKHSGPEPDTDTETASFLLPPVIVGKLVVPEPTEVLL